MSVCLKKQLLQNAYAAHQREQNKEKYQTLRYESGLFHVCHLCVSVNEYADGEKPEYHQRKGDEKTHMQRAYVYHGFIIAHDIPNGDYK